ncbi:MAG: hypothetical protein A2489_03405 [Candidatus Moranbacteria bacterium RIFOXYC12_FULL_36_13]|nr:MAG: hypothetical protein A2489_03405 [Candidatus Moranbacteria bacterium RIFOXYC12_FULL_36_13]
MENYKKAILMGVIIIFVILGIFLLIKVMKKTPPTAVEAPKVSQENINEESQQNGTYQLTEEERAELAQIRNTSGKIKSVDIDTIVIAEETGNLTLKVPPTGANFFSQTVQKDGSFLNKEIGLLELPKDKKVDIQYNSQKMEVMLVVVK